MFKYFNKEKKKSLTIQHIMSVEEFFNRAEFEIGNDIWKMSSSQLEETINKQEKFIKHLQSLYSQQLEFLESDKSKHDENIRKLNNLIEELQIKNESNAQQKELIEQQYKEIYQKLQVKDLKEASIQTNNDEELIRLRSQCESASKEMRRLQEENDDVSTALDIEKQHKIQITNQFQLKIQQLEQKIQQLEQTNQQYIKEHNKELEQLQIRLTNNFQVDLNSKTKELESKLLQEKIKTEQKQKDCVRLEDEIKELKKHLEEQAQKYEHREGKLQLLESKRQRDKNEIQQLKHELQVGKKTLQEQNLKLINELSSANNEISSLKDQIQMQSLIVDKKQEDNSNHQHQEKELKIQKLELIVNEQQQFIIQLERKLDQVESSSLIRITELEKIIDQLNIKRENARREISELSEKLQHSQTDLNASTSSRKSHKPPNIGHQKQRFQLFPTIKQMLTDLRKTEDACYKQFMRTIMAQSINQKELLKIECVLNDISRMTQDILDLLEEMGLI